MDRITNKVIISCAAQAAGVEIDYDKLAKDIIKTVGAGAAIVHLHSRDVHGAISRDQSLMEETFNKAKGRAKDFIVQVSTGGVSDLTIEERCSVLSYDKAESCSLNGGSTNLGEAVYVNSFEDIRYVAKHAYEANILPEIEVFDIGMIAAVEKLAAKQPFVKDGNPKLYNLVFGHPGGMKPTIDGLVAFKHFVPAGDLWSVTHFGRTDWTFLAAAIAMGACEIRIGFEDSAYIADDHNATSNAELVERAAELIKSMGLEIADATDARRILSM